MLAGHVVHAARIALQDEHHEDLLTKLSVSSRKPYSELKHGQGTGVK